MWLPPQWTGLKTVYLDFLSSFLILTLAGLDLSGVDGGVCVGEADPGNHRTSGDPSAAEGRVQGDGAEGSGVAQVEEFGRNTQVLHKFMVEMSKGGAVPATGPRRNCTCVKPRVPVSFLWEVRAEGAWSAWWCGNLWASVSGWPGVSGCVELGVAGLREAAKNRGSRKEASLQPWEGGRVGLTSPVVILVRAAFLLSQYSLEGSPG